MPKVDNKHKDDDDSDVVRVDETDSKEEKQVAKVEDLREEIKQSLNLRVGLANYDDVIVRPLWNRNYRVNCYRNTKIVDSYFIVYSKDEGILNSYPALPYKELI